MANPDYQQQKSASKNSTMKNSGFWWDSEGGRSVWIWMWGVAKAKVSGFARCVILPYHLRCGLFINREIYTGTWILWVFRHEVDYALGHLFSINQAPVEINLTDVWGTSHTDLKAFVIVKKIIFLLR